MLKAVYNHKKHKLIRPPIPTPPFPRWTDPGYLSMTYGPRGRGSGLLLAPISKNCEDGCHEGGGLLTLPLARASITPSCGRLEGVARVSCLTLPSLPAE